MCDCDDCFNVAMDPLVGQEPWRKSRLVGATGPTGPTGVVQNMGSPTGPYSALVDNDVCQMSLQGNHLLGCPGSKMLGVFVEATFGQASGLYRDGTCRLTTMAPADCSRGAWIEAEVVPRQDYPRDSTARQALPIAVSEYYTFFLGTRFPVGPQLQSSEEPIGFIMDERPLRFDGDAGFPYFNPPEFGVGPVRIRAGYNDTTLFDVYDSSAAGSTIGVSIGLMPFDAGAQQDATKTRIASSARIKGVNYCFPVDAPTSAIFIEGEAQSDLLKYNAVSVGFDASRMSVRPDVNQANVRPPAVAGFFRAVLSDNYTDAIVPETATGPPGTVPLTAAGIHQDAFYHTFLGEDLNSRESAFSYSNAKDAGKPQFAMKSRCKAVNGPTWHERNIIRYGSPLGVDGARHQARLTFDWEVPAPGDYCTANVYREWFLPSNGFNIACNPTFDILGGAVLDLYPVMAGKNLLPGQYASGPVELPEVNITSIPGLFSTLSGGSVPADVPVSISITPIVHAWATSSIRNRIVVPGSAEPQFGVTPTSWSSLSPPGTDGMTLDDYVELLPTLDFDQLRKRPAATSALAVDMEIWLRITVASVDVSGFGLDNSFSGNITRYFRVLVPQPNTLSPGRRTITLGFTDEEAELLSSGGELGGARRINPASSFPGFNTAGNTFSTFGNPYKIQFSIYEP